LLRMEFIFDTSKKGLETVMRDHQAICLSFVWEKGEKGATTSEAWLHVNKILFAEEKTISRASIIQFLRKMGEKGILKYWERSGKGGYHRVYAPLYDEAKFKELIAKQVIEKLMEEFEEETDNAIIKILDKIE